MTLPGIYCQRDPRWGQINLGFDSGTQGTIYNYGCLVTAIANLIWYTGNPTCTPANVNEWLKGNAGFSSSDEVVWGALGPLLGQTNVLSMGYSSDLDAVNNFLRDDNAFAIAWLTRPGFAMHFSVMPFIGQIADSWDGVLKPVEVFTFHGAHLYLKQTPAPPPPPPAPEPVPVTAPPVVAPTPEPVPSLETPVPDPTPAPEYQETFKSFAGGVQNDTIKINTQAVDVTGVGAPKDLTAGQVVAFSGTFSVAGVGYYRGTSGSWYGVPVSAVASSPGQTGGPVSVRVISNLESFGVEFVAMTEKRFGWFKRLARFLRFGNLN